MNPMLQRTAKVAAFPIAAVALVLVAEFLFSLGMEPVDYLPDRNLVPEELGTVMAPIDHGEFGGSAIRSVWPVQRSGAITAAVVVASAAGYRSRIDVAVSVTSEGAVRANHVVVQSESAYARRALEEEGPDALSGATLTEEGIRLATDAAVATARDYFEEQR